jgi:hypothetical protein
MGTTGQEFLLTCERERNATTRDAFGTEAYTQHRVRQMALLRALRGERIAILGAGNCNDLDLPAIATSFQEIHLFDIDGKALERAVERQDTAVKPACRLHERDLTGVARLLDEWRVTSPDPMPAQLAAWKELSPLLAEVGEFDAVISTCLLSQVAINLRDFFGITPALNSALCAAIVGHVLLAAALTKPGGTLLIVSDCITSQFPIHEEAKQRGPLAAIFHLAAQGAAFPGTDPELIAGVLQGTEIAGAEFKDAWLWHLTPEQQYLVYALQGTRRN